MRNGRSAQSFAKPAVPQPLGVLLVDDSAIVRERLCALLTGERSVRQVSEAANGAEAWSLFEQLAPEVVLLDIQLSDHTALGLLSRIKRASPGCLVIVLTNLQEPVFRREAERRGADEFLHKATEFERVIDLLRSYANCGRSTVLPTRV